MPRVIAFDIDGTLVDLLPAIHAGLSELRLYPDVAPALAALGTRYLLGVGSNGNSHARRCGLGGTFAFEVYAHVDGLPPKPSPRFFDRLVAAATGVSSADLTPADVVYVGDSLDDDIAPAVAAGLRTVWLNRHVAPAPLDLRCDAVIGTLADLPGAVEALVPLSPLAS